jgi:hypothetical protein
MAALIAVLLTLAPFALYLAWRRYGGGGGEPSSGVILALLAGVGLMLGAGAWYGLSRSFDAGETYVPAVLGPDGRIQRGHAEPGR